MRFTEWLGIKGDTDGIVQYDLLRWFSLVSVLIITFVALGLGFVASRFVVNESIQRDAALTAEFIQSLASTQLGTHHLPQNQMGEMLDPRADLVYSNETRSRRQVARREFLEHIENIARQPDTLLVTIYAPDNVVIWSSNPALMGTTVAEDDQLNESFATKTRIFATYHDVVPEREEQKFQRPPKGFFIENYIPMLNASGEAVAMIEIYKEPSDLVARTQRGYILMWLATSVGGALIYLALYRIVRRASAILAAQQKQILQNEAFVAMGEMSAAVAHSLRNPLASIRSSAELVQELAPANVHRNVGDIIFQVDRMASWVRDLLATSSPAAAAAEPVDPIAAIHETLAAHQPQISACQVDVELALPETAQPVVSQRVLLLQVLNSLVSNALEAMPKGGKLSIELARAESGRKLVLIVTDTGNGMSDIQRKRLFQPFTTTKQGGLGVGLVMVKRIMERFGGTVGIHSKQDEGTRVELTLQLAS